MMMWHFSSDLSAFLGFAFGTGCFFLEPFESRFYKALDSLIAAVRGSYIGYELYFAGDMSAKIALGRC